MSKNVVEGYGTAVKIRELFDTGLRKHSISKLADRFDLSYRQVSDIVNGKVFTKKPKAPKNSTVEVEWNGNTYYKLKSGRIWSYNSQSFLKSLPGRMPRGLRQLFECQIPEGEYKEYHPKLSKHALLVYSDGRVWSTYYNRLVPGYVNDKGYVFHCNEPLHRIVLTLFDRPPEENEEGRHLDGNPANNDISNLAWGVRQKNVDDMIVHGTKGKGKVYANARMTEAKAQELINRWEKKGHKYGTMRDFAKEASAETGVSETSIYNLLTGATWKYLKRKKVHAPAQNTRRGSGDCLTAKQRKRIKKKFAQTKNTEGVFVANASTHFGVTKYAIRKIIHT